MVVYTPSEILQLMKAESDKAAIPLRKTPAGSASKTSKLSAVMMLLKSKKKMPNNVLKRKKVTKRGKLHEKRDHSIGLGLWTST
jgi:hypothetical protein